MPEETTETVKAEMSYGTKELKELLKFTIGLGEAFDQAMADKKFEMTEIALLIGPLMDSAAAFEGMDIIALELKDLDNAEMAELVRYVEEELDLKNDKIELVIEKALALGVNILSFISLFKK